MFQVEYAMEAVKQGAPCVGATSKKFAVLAALKRSPSELARHQEKVFTIDDHCGICISGLTADARSLCKYMRTECLNHRYVYDSALQVSRLVEDVADKHQECTQMYVRRPYGVGLLVAGYDRTGAHLFQTCPSGNFWEFRAMAIGARSQSAKTYLEKHHLEFPDLGRDELIRHAVKALSTCVTDDQTLTEENTSIGIVGEGLAFTSLSPSEVAPFVAEVQRSAGAGEEETKEEGAGAGAGAGAGMDIEA